MTKIKAYFLLAALFFVLAGPWLITPEIKAESDKKVEEAFCACCDGPCHGCCCAMPASKSESDDSEKSSCSCKITETPAVPEQPFDITEHHVDNNSNQNIIIEEITADYQALAEIDYYTPGASPPDLYPPPLYILNTSFLI